MKEKKDLAQRIGHYARYLKTLVFIRRLLGITSVAAGVVMIVMPVHSSVFWIGFNAFCFSLILFVISRPLVGAVRSVLEGAEALQALCEDCDAGDALYKWREEHLLADWSEPEVQTLLRNQIESKERFLDTHPFIKDRESYLARFHALLR
ncbi:MAG: hypothetical protein UX37_C0021G0002 [Microgenomates group bacterium GW2011_GWA2_46_16]|nr:MAG: hypothetical protein UX37_C0021G0002 [Microgenomates group bacterium GW2011_GWA2_46_16]